MKLGKNICIAPFTQITYSPFGSASPCPYLGGVSWKFGTHSLSTIWASEQMTSLRNSFRENQQDPVCSRCWEEESNGKQSLRKMLLTANRYKDSVIDHIQSEAYLEGPRQINLRVGNLCNLRCRTCDTFSSVTYAVEGKQYVEQFGSEVARYTNHPKVMEFSEQQVDEIIALTNNVRRIEFYGGEPMLDIPTLRLLEHLVRNGKSREITLFYNTNGMVKPNHRQLLLWKKFESLEFNFSIDGVGDQFRYIRHPGSWSDMLDTIDHIRNDISPLVNAICTVSPLNVYYLPEIIEEFNRLDMKYFLNLVTNPDYYDVRHMPNDVKSAVIQKLSKYPQHAQLDNIKRLLETQGNLAHWERFLQLTKAKDRYRQENFRDTFPEFAELIGWQS